MNSRFDVIDIWAIIAIKSGLFELPNKIKKKKPAGISCGCLYAYKYAKTMGEEKPAEKLMGKRKSPRLEQHLN